MKMDFKWSGYASFQFKSLLLKQTKQEPIVLASSKLTEAKIHLAKRNALSEGSITKTLLHSQERR